jgi:RND superfamily putative drug exporter
MKVFARPVARRTTALITLLLAIGATVALFLAPAPSPAVPASTDLPSSYDSRVVADQLATMPDSGSAPAIIVYSRADGAALTPADLAAVKASAAAGGAVQGVQVSANGQVAIAVKSIDTSVSDVATGDAVTKLRADVARGLPSDLKVQVTGGPAFTTDLGKVFDGADVKLLLTTVLVVAVLLLITYRSPWLWLVPLTVVLVADQLTVKVVNLLAPVFNMPIDAAAAGITSVLVFGAGTDYALLLIARYREQLRVQESRYEAMQTAVVRTSEPVLASAGTVVVSLLVLLLSQQASVRAIGFAGAIGIVIAMIFGLLVLPAALVIFGRGLFWPFVPRFGSQVKEGRFWGALGVRVARRPWWVGAASVVVLAVLALGGVGLTNGLSQNEQFRAKPEAVAGQETLSKGFPAGATEPLTVTVVPSSATAQVAATATASPGVASAQVGMSGADFGTVDVVLKAAPGTAASDAAIAALRTNLDGMDGVTARVGGSVAEQYDLKAAASRDRILIIPIILLIVGFVLLALLRSIVAAPILVASVVATYFAAVGASWFVFQHVYGFPALDTGVLLLSFVFLVALGVDYNIFLVTRAREEALNSGTKIGMLNALRVTGGVITSAGILLAAVFAVLGVLPLIALTQIGVIVGIGVLLDTLLVRTVLVPALVFIIGDKFWWPTKISADVRAPEDVVEVTV